MTREVCDDKDGAAGHSDHGSLVLACAADDHYSMPTAVMLYSALSNYQSTWPVKVYILDAGIASENEIKLRKVLASFDVSVRWIRPNVEAIRDLLTRKHLTITTHLRTLIPELLPATVAKAIYLDCDVLVEGDIGELWRKNLGQNYFLAVQDRGKKALIATSPIGLCPEIIFDEGAEYFNAGVLVMNLHLLKKEGFSEKVIQFTKRRAEVILNPNQDGVNAIAVGKWEKLDPIWNQIVKGKTDFKKQPGGILHYMGPNKPWLSQKPTRRRPDGVRAAHRLYDEYASRCGWFTSAEWVRYLALRTARGYRLRVTDALKRK